MTRTSDRSASSASNGNGRRDSTGNGAMPPIDINGNGNGNGNGSIPMDNVVPPSFDQPVILRQSPTWAKMIAIGIMGVTTATVAWACIARVDESVVAQGKLEPKGIVQLVQAPVGGVVEEVLVEEGESVESGQVVATLDESSTEAQLESNQQILSQLRAENDYYRAQQSGITNAVAPEGVSLDLIQRGRDRAQLQDSNRLLRAQISGDTSGLSADQIDRLETSESRLNSQQSINRLQASQLREQLQQTQAQLSNARRSLANEQDIEGRLATLNEQGAVAELQYLQQQQAVRDQQTEVNTLTEEVDRLNFQISQAQQEVSRTGFESTETLQERIAANDQRIADIDEQIAQRVSANDQRIQELEAQQSQLEQNIRYQALTAPVDGTVFNLKANQGGYVANSTEPLMEIVPQDSLVARVFVSSRDIGFVEIGQKVDVRIDAYSFSEFGDMEGTLVDIGEDSLPPDETYPYYRFPAEVLLEDQSFVADGVPLELRSGMSLNANIKLRKRRVITFLTDLFKRKLDSVTSGS